MPGPQLTLLHVVPPPPLSATPASPDEVHAPIETHGRVGPAHVSQNVTPSQPQYCRLARPHAKFIWHTPFDTPQPAAAYTQT